MKKALFFLFFAGVWFGGMAQSPREDERAFQLFQNGNWLKASELYENLFEQGRHPEYYDTYMESLLKSQQYDRARGVLDLMQKQDPQSYIYRVDYGRLLQEEGSKPLADEWFSKLIEDMPKDEFAIRDLAIAFYRAKAYDYTIKTFLTGRKLLNNETAFSFDLISLYQFQKNKAMLVAEYMRLLESSNEPELLKRVQTTFENVFDSPNDYVLLKDALLQKQSSPQLSELLVWVLLKQKDFGAALQHSIARDKKLKGGATGILDICEVLISNKQFKLAKEGLQYILSKGRAHPDFLAARMQLLYSDSELLSSADANPQALERLEAGYVSILDELGTTATAVPVIKQLSRLKALRLNKIGEAVSLLRASLDLPDLPALDRAGLKLDLGDMYLLTGDAWEAGLVYAQVEKEFRHDAVGQDATYRKAKLSYFLGDFVWARAQLDVLKSATSQLIANDVLNLNLLIMENTASAQDSAALRYYARADLLLFRNMDDGALLTLDSIDVLFPGNSLSDDLLMSKSRIYLKKKDFKQAITALNSIASDFSHDIWADDALFMLGELYENELADELKASEYYHRIITAYPKSPFIEEARIRFRKLRGDGLG